MIRSAFAISVGAYAFLLIVLVKECLFLAPLKEVLWKDYATPFILWSAVLILNIFCLCYAVLRRIALEDTGGKLAHLEKQLRGKETISQELSSHLEGK